MSHFKERTEKNCLNCGTEVQGKYCHTCGQENIEPFETAWHLVTHFFNDITHFDGKFFSTLKYLIFRPGFVSKEYMLGRRASYLNPIRMYIFTSAIFFLIFFSITNFDENSVSTTVNGHSMKEIEKMDSASFSAFIKGVDNGKITTRNDFAKYMDTSRKKGTIHIAAEDYRDKAQYDSALKTGTIKHGWFKRTLMYKQIELNEKYQRDGNKILISFVSTLIHSFPQMLFISLPLFALILKLLYIRRKKYYYAIHVIFSVHLYIFVFIFLLFLIGLSQLNHYLLWNWLDWIVILAGFFIFIYQYKAMRKFYLQGRGKTILKFILLNLLMLFLIMLLVIIFSFFSLLKI